MTRALLVAVGIGVTLAESSGSDGTAWRRHRASAARFKIMTNKIGCRDRARLEVLIFNQLFVLSPSTPALPGPPPQPVTATLWVLRARRATRPQASAPARMASLASPATAAPKVTSRAAPPSPPASVSHKHTEKYYSCWIKSY